MNIGAIIIFLIVAGLIAGFIGQVRTGKFIGYFLLGVALPIVGILVAATSKRATPPPQPPGWYPDPWRQAQWRWYDGHQWSWQTHTGQSETAPQPEA